MIRERVNNFCNRVKIYINGEQQTLTESQLGFPGQNYEGAVNNNVTHTIGNWEGNSYYFDGSMSHIHFIDGTAYDASAFGETDATTGEWKIKTDVSVTYGTNGFFLKFLKLNHQNLCVLQK